MTRIVLVFEFMTLLCFVCRRAEHVSLQPLVIYNYTLIARDISSIVYTNFRQIFVYTDNFRS